MSEAIELYVHIPFCMRKCLYCDFLSGPYDRVDRERYTKALLQEIRYYGDVLNHPRVRSLFVGVEHQPGWSRNGWKKFYVRYVLHLTWKKIVKLPWSVIRGR